MFCGFLVCVNAVVMCGSLHTPLVDTSLFSWGQFVGISQRENLRGRGERINPKQSGDFPPAPVTVLSLHSLSLHPHPSFPRFTSMFRDMICGLEGSLLTFVALNIPFCLGRRLSSSLLFVGIESLFAACVCGKLGAWVSCRVFGNLVFSPFLQVRTTDN